jgi:copper chaperone NosL
MSSLIDGLNRYLHSDVELTPRALVVLAAVLMIAVYLFPLWQLTMFAPQYPNGLRLNIYSYKLDGGNGGQDVKEVNVLNHYIGMKELTTEAFTEFKWIPFVVGGMALLFLRSAVHGQMHTLVDVVVMYVYFAMFSLWSFAYKLYTYGHNLDPTAAVKVPPFMPPVFGYRKIANFEIYSYPGAASYALGGVLLVLLSALFLSWRSYERAPKARTAKA